MKRIMLPVLLMLAILFAMNPAVTHAETITIDMDIAPNVLVLGVQGEWITVHTDLPFSTVDTSVDVLLDGIPADQVFADDCGDLVAKFDQDTFKDMFQDITGSTSVSFEMTGACINGDDFIGEDSFTVKAKGKK